MGGILGKLTRWTGEGKREFCAVGQEYVPGITRSWYEGVLCVFYGQGDGAVF